MARQATIGDIGQIEVSGMDEMFAALKALPLRVQNKVCKGATESAATYLCVEAKRECPVGGDKLTSRGRAAKAYGATIADDLATHKGGTLRDNIKVQPIKKRRGRVGHIVIVGDGWYGGDVFYGAFVEFGYHAGSRKSTVVGKQKVVIGKSKRGHDKTRIRNVIEDGRTFVPPNPFMRRAFDKNRQAIADRLVGVISKGIEQEADRLARKAIRSAERAGQ